MDLFKTLEHMALNFLPHDWRGKHEINGKKVADLTVVKVDCGLNPAALLDWVSVRYVDGAFKPKLMGKMKVQETGKQGGADEIIFYSGESDTTGTAVDHDDVVIGTQANWHHFPPSLDLVFAYKYSIGSDFHRVEFAGAIPIPLLKGV